MSLFRTYRRVILSLPVWLTLLVAAAHAAPPDAGTLLESVKPAQGLPLRGTEALPEAPVRPAMKLDATVRIAVKGIRITGHYRAAGYLLARA